MMYIKVGNGLTVRFWDSRISALISTYCQTKGHYLPQNGIQFHEKIPQTTSPLLPCHFVVIPLKHRY